jgi:hypothetical protein
MISHLISPLARPKEQQAFDEANAAYYSSVDWALDIRDAAFEEADLRGIPAHLVCRDPATQVVVTRHKALEGAWRQLDLSGPYWPMSLEILLSESQAPAVVLVAPKRDPQYGKLLEDLRKLRDAGVAEPD